MQTYASSSGERLTTIVAASLFAFGLAAFGSIANAGVMYDTGALEFESTGQSMWGSGTAFRAADSEFVGTIWNDKTATIGGIAGDENEVVFPALGAVTIPVFEPRIFVPTPTWSNPFKGYHTGCGCWKDVVIKPATAAITADTRTGAQLNLHTSGKVGLEFGYSIDSGSVDTTATFGAMAELPEQVNADQFFSFDTSSAFESGAIKTQSPWVEAYMSAIMELSGSMDAQACALTFGCKESGTIALPSVDLNQRILSIDPNSLKVLDGVSPGGEPFAEVPIANQSLTLEGGATLAPPTVGFKLTGPFGVTLATSMPPTPAVTVDLAEATLSIPNIATEGSGSGEKVTSNGRDDLLSVQVDLDGAATLLGGLPPVGLGFDVIDAGVFKLSVSLDLIDVDAGPVLGIMQEFEFEPTLMVTLDFSDEIKIGSLPGLHTSWTGLWSELPEFAITQDTTFTPTFWLDAMLRNVTGLDLGLVGTLDILKLGATGIIGGFDVLNFSPISLNSILGIDNTLFETDKLELPIYDELFALGGFDPVAGTPFTLRVANGSGSGSGTEPDIGPGAAVPEPPLVALLLAVLLAFGASRARRAG